MRIKLFEVSVFNLNRVAYAKYNAKRKLDFDSGKLDLDNENLIMIVENLIMNLG